MFTRPDYENQILRLLALPKDKQTKTIAEMDTKNFLELYPIMKDQYARLVQQERVLREEDCWNMLNEAIDLDNSSLVMERLGELDNHWIDKVLGKIMNNEFLQKYDQWKIVSEKQKKMCDLLLQMDPIYKKYKSVTVNKVDEEVYACGPR